MPRVQFSIGGLVITVEGDSKSMRISDDSDAPRSVPITTKEEKEIVIPPEYRSDERKIRGAIGEGYFDNPRTFNQIMKKYDIHPNGLKKIMDMFVVRKVLNVNKNRWGFLQYFKK